MKDKIRKSEFKFLNYLFENMYSVKSKFYPDSTFFKKDDKVILELEKSGTLWVLYSVWTDISDMFSYGYEETQQIIKEWVEAQLKKVVVEPLDAGSNYLPFMEKQLKQEEITPQHSIPLQSWRDLEKKEVTPRYAIAPPFRWRKLDSVKYAEIKPNVPLSTYHLKEVEEQLKSEEITPTISTSYRLEQRLKSKEMTRCQVVNGSFEWIQEQINLGEEQLKSEEITPRQVVNGSFDWIQEQINLGEVTPTSFFVIK